MYLNGTDFYVLKEKRQEGKSELSNINNFLKIATNDIYSS